MPLTQTAEENLQQLARIEAHQEALGLLLDVADVLHFRAFPRDLDTNDIRIDLPADAESKPHGFEFTWKNVSINFERVVVFISGDITERRELMLPTPICMSEKDTVTLHWSLTNGF